MANKGQQIAEIVRKTPNEWAREQDIKVPTPKQKTSGKTITKKKGKRSQK